MKNLPQPPSLPKMPVSAVTVRTDGYEQQLGNDEPVLRETVQVQRFAAEALEALEDVRQARKPSDPPAAHLDLIGKHARQTAKAIQDKAQRNLENLRYQLASLDQAVESAIVGTAPQDAGEIRQVLRELPEAERGRAVEAAIQSQDRQTLAAIFSGKPLTVGLSPDAFTKYKALAARAVAGDLLAKRGKLTKAEALAAELSRVAENLPKTALGPEDVQTKFAQEHVRHDMAVMKLLGALAGTGNG